MLKNKTYFKEAKIDFPCNFPIKVMGAAIPEFHTRILQIAQQHDVTFGQHKIKQKNSKKGKYTSLTLNINATDKKQLNAIYQDLSNCELVLWAL